MSHSPLKKLRFYKYLLKRVIGSFLKWGPACFYPCARKDIDLDQLEAWFSKLRYRKSGAFALWPCLAADVLFPNVVPKGRPPSASL